MDLDACAHTDANATLGIVNRQGLGKLRHVKVQYLWLQERVKIKDMKIIKAPGKDKSADLMTKYWVGRGLGGGPSCGSYDSRMRAAFLL